MLTSVLKPIEVRFVSVVIVACLLVVTSAAHAAGPNQDKTGGTISSPAKPGKNGQPQGAQAPAAAPVQAGGWGPYLDVAYELTYWDKPEIKDWREKSEREIGETLSAYITTWNGKLAGSLDNAGVVRNDDRQPGYRERDYLRLAIAQTVDYLQSGNRESLNGAARVLEKLKDKTTMPEVAFWTGYVKALQALEDNNSAQFVARVFDIWNNAVMYVEQGTMADKASNAANGASTPFYYRNVVNLVVNRAIIDRKLADLNALGPLILMLTQRDFEDNGGEGQYFTTLVQRIAEGLIAPDSDRYRLNFTVAAIESKRLQQIAEAKIDGEGMSEQAQKVFEQSRLFNDYALKWASSRRSSGVVMEVADYLDLTSFAIQRLSDNEKAPAYKFFAALPSQDGSSTLLKAMAIFNDIAVYSDGGWEKAGYANRELYLKATHRLWRTIMELALWTGDFYLAKLNSATDQQGIFSSAAPMQMVMDSYLDFLASQKNRGYNDAIPDFAYFGAAEAAEKLAYANLRAYEYSTDSTAYNLWFLNRLKATELFPLDPGEIAKTAAILKRDGRYNLFLDNFLPLAGRLKQSAAVKKWLEEHKSDSAKAISDYVKSIDDVFVPDPGGNNSGKVKGTELSSFDATFRQLREELQRKPDHPIHKLLKAFYTEEMQKKTSYTRLLMDSNRLNLNL